MLENDNPVTLNKEDEKEIVGNLDSIIEASFDLCRTLYPNKNPEVIFIDEDIYEKYTALHVKERDRIINHLLRMYFLGKDLNL